MTVTTFSFTYSGGIEDWVVPFHTGTIRLDVAIRAIYGSALPAARLLTHAQAAGLA